MAGAFSGHLINQYNPNSPFNSSIVSHGAMSFNPNMHGMPQGQPERSFSFFGNDPSFANDSISEESARKLASLQVKLNQKLGPEYISQRPGPGGGPKLTYVEGWKIINMANEVFGFNGWSSTIVSMTVDFADYNEESRRFNVGVTAVMRVTLRDGVFHEDVGYGMLENSKSKGQALDKVLWHCSSFLLPSDATLSQVQKGGCNGWPQTSAKKFWKCHGKLLVRQVICIRNCEGQI